ncbi:LLM class F420-dependent oxidoreductase [Fodinicola acaciae]|uniref:LLM class F420-dependent oxidoreductase n=1 Tax=Fodinicola acaciae TaxID=2681555 RepID=UPI0013D7FDE5|nr:LLM class F420-dependent oxidoreductase [Fodinicola acaciae]
MKFGLSTFITDRGIQPADLGRAAEERGFDSIFVAEHSHIPVRRESPYPGGGDLPEIYYRTLDPFVALSAIAAVTERLIVGTGVALVIQRDTIHTAKEVATLDLVSGGRAAFGVGAGWNREEMRNHGTDPATRGARLDEQLRAIKEIWTKDQAEFHGKHVDFDPIFAWPKPVQQPHVPIYVGGEGERARRRVAELGDVWLPNATRQPDDLAGAIASMRDEAGRDIPVTIYGERSLTPDIDAYERAGVERVLLYLPTLPRDESLRHLDKLAQIVS